MIKPVLLVPLIRGDEPNFRAARDLLIGKLTDPDAYAETHGKDTNRDLNRWAALKVAFAGLDPKWAFDSLAPSAPTLGNWKWREKTGKGRAPGSQNIPCHENACKLYMACLREDRAAARALISWWSYWALYMSNIAWMGDELMSREYGATVAEAVHAVLELPNRLEALSLTLPPFLRRGEGHFHANFDNAASALTEYLDRWYLEHALRVVPVVKLPMQRRSSLQTDLRLSCATAGLRSAPQYEMANQAEPLLAIAAGFPLVNGVRDDKFFTREAPPWTKYPCDDRVAIPALCTAYKPSPRVLEALKSRMLHPEVPLDAEGISPAVTSYQTAYAPDGGVLSWLGEDTNKETVPTIVYGISRDGTVISVLPLGDGPKPHRKVPPSQVYSTRWPDGTVNLTVAQFSRDGVSSQAYRTIEWKGHEV